MNAKQRKIIRDHARNAGHLVELWDASDCRWYARFKFRPAQQGPNQATAKVKS